MFADIMPATRQGQASLPGPLFHQLMMPDLIIPAFFKRGKAAHPGLVFDPLLRAHELPATGVRLTGPPGASRRRCSNQQESEEQDGNELYLHDQLPENILSATVFRQLISRHLARQPKFLLTRSALQLATQ